MSSGCSAAHSLMSAPTQNALSPPPVSITTRTAVSASSSRAHCSSSSSIAGVSELSLAGRASVTVATSPSRCSCTSCSATAHLLASELQAERRIGEERGVHHAQIGGDAERNLRLVDHVALQVDAGRYLRDHQAFVAQLDDAALGDIGDMLAALTPDAAAEGDVLCGLDELAGAPFLDDRQLAVADLELGAG